MIVADPAEVRAVRVDSMEATVALPNLNIRARLIAGFAALCAMLALVVAITIVNVGALSTATATMVGLRVPTALAAGDLSAKVYATLAALRGWVITGTDAFKGERTALWRDMAADSAELDRLSANWTDPRNRTAWAEAKPLLDALHAAQDKVEAVAHTADEQPAAKILQTEAAPLAKSILDQATVLIDEEGRIASTDVRKSLLVAFADTRGSMAMAIGAIRAYLLTGDPAFQKEFDTLWAINQAKVALLAQRRAEMSQAQAAAFDRLVQARDRFAPLPPRMFAIRASDRWNEAHWLLANEAAPRAGRLVELLNGRADASGERQDGLVPRQRADLIDDGAATEAQATLLTRLLWVMLGVGIGIAVTVVVVTSRSIVPPLVGMTATMTRLAEGDYGAEVPSTGRGDEIGLMARSVQVFKEALIRARDLAAKEAAEMQARMVRAERVSALTERFDDEMSAMLKAVASAATEMQSTATSMTATAEQTSRQAAAVAAATEQASANVQTVATATEELSGSITEIGRQVAQSAAIAQGAVEVARKTSTTVGGLADAAERIGDVVQLIADIASQTNLLALNATIEAARAGEAGKGFAVVAAEVKSLATQTARATGDIGAQVGAIQASARDVVTAIQQMGSTIAEMSQVASAIAGAVEEQSAATQEIARNVQQAAAGTTEISSNIAGVTEAAAETGTAAHQVLAASGELSDQSETVRRQVETFIAEIQAA